jgi:hypothetical protein
MPLHKWIPLFISGESSVDRLDIMKRPTSPSAFPRSKRLLRTNFLSKHDTEFSKHDIEPKKVSRIEQHLIQFC